MDDAGALRDEDGLFTHSGKHIGGFYIIEAESMKDALVWARRGRFMVGANEVRELFAE